MVYKTSHIRITYIVVVYKTNSKILRYIVGSSTIVRYQRNKTSSITLTYIFLWWYYRRQVGKIERET